MKNFLIFFIIYMVSQILIQPWCSANADEIWKKFGEENGVIGYSKSVSDSEYQVVKGITIIDQALPTIGNVLRDIPAFSEWMSTQKESILLEKINPRQLLIYNSLDISWFLKL